MSADLRSRYLGLMLRNPIVASASRLGVFISIAKRKRFKIFVTLAVIIPERLGERLGQPFGGKRIIKSIGEPIAKRIPERLSQSIRGG